MLWFFLSIDQDTDTLRPGDFTFRVPSSYREGTRFTTGRSLSGGKVRHMILIKGRMTNRNDFITAKVNESKTTWRTLKKDGECYPNGTLKGGLVKEERVT